MKTILGIESSCDDLSMSVLREGRPLATVTASQVKDHQPYGGVVPEIASRKHLEYLAPTLELVLERSGIQAQDLDGVAATYAPGLVGSLLVGLNFAKGLAYALDRPFRGVHHIEAHLMSPFLEHEARFPFLGLVVSGGHTHLYWVKGIGDYRCLGHTVDDAAGEAFDKLAKAMGLPYPGGPVIEKLAADGDPQAFEFARPRVKAGDHLTSFSGMKTAALNILESMGPERHADLAASFQRAITQTLCQWVEREWTRYPQVPLILAGGVACNKDLRRGLQALAQGKGVDLVLPSPAYCTDNGAMVAWTAWQYLKLGLTSPLSLNARARCELGPLERVS